MRRQAKVMSGESAAMERDESQESQKLERVLLEKRWKERRARRFFRYISLTYTLFFLIDPILSHRRDAWIALAIAYPIFLLSFVVAAETRGRTRWIAYTVLFAVGYVYMPFNSSASGLFVYPVAMLPFILKKPRKALVAMGAQVSGMFLEMAIFGLNRWAVCVGVFFVVVITLTNLYYAEQERSNAKLKLANEEIEHLATVAERERIARDLHDLLGHTLTVIALKSELAGKLITSDPNAAASEIAEIQQTSRKALAEVREAVLGYRSQGLSAEVDRARKALATADIKLICDGLPNELPIAEETVLCLAVRESVTNIMRHSEATEVWMQFRFRDGRLHVTVADNGKGGVKEEGSGLRGMRERVEALGGRLSIQSEVGTQLTIDLPQGAATA
ncbi:MAG: sensor histidine kinase [Acidobacteriaceae bacterium]|nr:sensor histidine kinase [Acidobacteriaceae bacterium]